MTIAALEIQIFSLDSLRNNTIQQREDAINETKQLEQLNTTLLGVRQSLDNYSLQISIAKQQNSTGMVAALDNASTSLTTLNSSFGSARVEVQKLKGVLNQINTTIGKIDDVFDQALNQTASVNSLITTLQKTVATQTGKNPDQIAQPLSVKLENQYVRTSFLDFLMPQVIAISLLLSCFLLSSISLVREKMRSTIVRALLAPSALLNLVLGKIVTIVLLSCLQVLLIMIIGLGIFGVEMPNDIVTLFIGTIISALVLASIGLLIGFYAKTESAAVQGSLLLAIPMLFLGNILFSPDLLPNYTQILQQLLPLAHITNIFKVVLITNGNPIADFAALLSYFVILAFVLGFIVLRKRDLDFYR
ncbi:ABC transporter permease [Candidatus Micrarchaeota archaeon]|nr:ABC transporter permease [Candidatus Micrarchaeota archaeon]